MKKLFAGLLMAFAFSSAQAADTFIPDNWSDADTARQVMVVASLAADMSQTLQIKDNPSLHESNPILGKHPSDAKVIAYFAIVAIGHTYITSKVPAGWPRQTLQYGLIAVQVAQVIKNKRLGLNVKF